MREMSRRRDSAVCSAGVCDGRQDHDELAPGADAFAAASTVPPCIATRLRTSVRPMPSPPCARRFERSTCVNMSNTDESWSGAMPMPLSRTETTARRPSLRSWTRMWPPALVYLAALLSRFENTWVSRTVSPETVTGSSGRSMLS